MFVPALAAGLVSGAPQLGAGAAVATGAALGGSAVAGGLIAAGGARLGAGAVGGSLKAAAALTGRIGAAAATGGAAGVARTLLSAPAGRALGTPITHIRAAYREGAAQGIRDSQANSDAAAAPADAGDQAAPGWARALSRRHRTTQAALLAAQALREGDRPVAGGAPELKDKS